MIFAIFLIAHILGEYIFQTTSMEEKKKNSIIFVFFHTIIYGTIFLLTYFLVFQFSKVWISFVMITISHMILDISKEKLEKKCGENNPTFSFFSFLIEQVLHIFIFFLVLDLFSLDTHKNLYYQNLETLSYFSDIVLYTLLFLCILSPSSVFIKKMFLLFSKKANENEGTKAGNLIGKLERILIVILLLQNQYEAIGFVLGAKSIARFNQLDDKEFAEKYLVGTLASLLLALLSTLFVKKLGSL